MLLLFVVLMPFATTVAAEYLVLGGDDAGGAIALYAGSLLGMGLGFTAVFEWALRGGHIAIPSGPARHWARLRFSVGAVAYLVAIGVAFVSPIAAFIILFLVAIYYTFQPLPAPAESADQP